MGSKYNCVKGRIRPQITLWEGMMLHLCICERDGPSYLEEAQVRPDLLLKQRRQRVLPGRGQGSKDCCVEGLGCGLSRRARV